MRRAGSILLVAAALLAAALSPPARAADSGCGAPPSMQAVLARLNAIRAAGRACHPAAAWRAVVQPLNWSEELAAAALTQSREMALLRRMSHRDRADRSLGDRLKAQGYRFAAAFENVAVGFASLDDVVDAWLAREHHCENLMRESVVELGLACTDGGDAEPRGERRYWTLVLAAPRAR